MPAGKRAVPEMLEEDIVRHQAGHRDHRPAGALAEPFVDLAEFGDAGMGEAEHLQPLVERIHRAAGKLLLLAGEQQIPDAMLVAGERLPILRHRPVGGRAFGRRGRILGRAVPLRRWFCDVVEH